MSLTHHVTFALTIEFIPLQPIKLHVTRPHSLTRQRVNALFALFLIEQRVVSIHVFVELDKVRLQMKVLSVGAREVLGTKAVSL